MSNKFNLKIADIARGKIGEYVRNRRKKLNISQAELSEKINVRAATVSDFEKGKSNITINSLIAMLGVLRIEMQFVETDPGSMPGFEAPNKN